ncbi:hypothetical protein [Flavobacterium sp. GT3R68]|uniref:hypothetical protein n=1 Tax=Flavobacterium sp. GT3R68 TaxID=2594437 RepID=UPI000F8879EC|nr:hypothetical protein [Flavobacterium sp. GT3R68]RTY85559.1 hypothetical protein EKL32_28490 [Flavobacterium sp. GSN2]TRW89365.1 hypothetical protein FNW07_13410 [Flavobacterium sp. GT3R68]
MDEFFYSLLLILVPILIFGIPILLSYWVYKIFKKKDIKPKWRILAFLPIFVIGYFVYSAFYPSSEFYETDFKEVTGIELPQETEFEYKTSSYPDQHGDYTSVSIIKVETDFYKNLQSKLSENGLFENENRLGCPELDNAEREMSGLKIEREFSKELDDSFYYVAFLSDKSSILVQRSSH